MKKKLLAILLTVCMVLSMAPAALAAGEGTDTVATVNGTAYTDLQKAIEDAAPSGTVELVADVTVEEWVMISETLSISNGNIITIDSINGLTIDGNNHTLTINSIESAGNGNRLFYDATNLNIKDLTIAYANGLAGGIGLTSGTIENVTFDGGVTAVYPGAGEVTVSGCTFATNGTAIYYEEERDNLIVTGNTFNQPDDVNVILLRGDTTFTNNTINSGRTVNIVSGSPTVTDNDFNNVRLKVYSVATAAVSGNEINNLAFEDDATNVNSTFGSNTLGETAQEVLDTVTYKTYVASVNGTNYTDIQEAIKAAAPSGIVEILTDVTVDEWVMISETLSISNGNIITIDNINGLTIDGNNHTLTINSIESAGNGNRLFYDATNLNIKDLTIAYANGLAGGIGLTSGTIENVTFDGGVTAVYPGAGEVTVSGCTFATNGTAIYYEEERDNLIVTGNTFNQPDDVNVILLRGDTTFTNNTINSGRTVNIVSGSPVVTGNDFGDVRLKVYDAATASIENNTINVLAFEDTSTEVKSTFTANTLSDDAETALANKEIENASYVAQVGEAKYADLQEAIKAAAPSGTVELLDNVTVEEWVMISETLSISNGNIITIDSINGLTIDGNNHTLTINSIESAGNGNRLFYDATNLNIKDLTIAYANGLAGGIGLTSGTIENVTFDGGVTAVYPGAGEVTVSGCTFATNGTAIYYEEERDNLIVTDNTFNQPDDVNVILLRGDTTFTDNTINSGRTVNVVGGSPVVSGNTFADGVRLKVYNGAAADIVNNTITVLAFNDDSEVESKFEGNILSADAQAVLDSMSVENTFDVTISVLDGATIVVKDSDRNEVTAEDDGTYKLVNGTYTYTVSKSGYNTKGGSFTVSNADVSFSVSLSVYIPYIPSDPSYRVTVNDLENGEVSITPASATAGQTVTITTDPDKGYVLETLTVLDKNGYEIKLTAQGNGKYTFKMPNGRVTVEATFVKAVAENPFVDVSKNAYYYDAVLWAVENGITTGTDADTFNPNAVCTRAQVVTFLWRAAGCPEPVGAADAFIDVESNAYYAKAVQWAVEQGITLGTGDNKFSPDAECTRGQIVTFLWRSQGSENATANNPFVDVANGAYYEDAVLWAVEEAITNGTGANTFSPDADCTRGQIVTFLYRCLAE